VVFLKGLRAVGDQSDHAVFEHPHQLAGSAAPAEMRRRQFTPVRAAEIRCATAEKNARAENPGTLDHRRWHQFANLPAARFLAQAGVAVEHDSGQRRGPGVTERNCVGDQAQAPNARWSGMHPPAESESRAGGMAQDGGLRGYRASLTTLTSRAVAADSSRQGADRRQQARSGLAAQRNPFGALCCGSTRRQALRAPEGENTAVSARAHRMMLSSTAPHRSAAGRRASATTSISDRWAAASRRRRRAKIQRFRAGNEEQCITRSG